MKTKNRGKKRKDLVKVSKAALLSLVASQVKDKDLFPEKTEQARRFLEKLQRRH